jgi:predicted RNA binding protein with dsRBD fold (UPF0201 family)
VSEATVATPLRPTENADRVRQAILNIFPEARLAGDDGIAGDAGSLDHFGELLRRQRIRDSAHEVLTGAVRGDRMVFYLNKQAAYVGRVSFSAHAPLGDVCVTVVSEDLRGLIEGLAPSTIRPRSRQPGPTP